MTRFLQSQALTGAVIVMVLILTLLALFRAVNFQDYGTNFNSSSLVFNLQNNRYLEITPVNDHIISIFGSQTVTPFSAADTNTLRVFGVDLGPVSKQYALTSVSDSSNRQITVTRTGSHTSELDFDLKLQYPAYQYRDYTIQIDYSAYPQQLYPISSGMRLADAGCTVDVTDNQTATYSTYNNDRTITVSVPYSPIMKFKINLQITCNQ